jgi:hypothetical protein
MIRKLLIVCTTAMGLLAFGALATEPVYKWVDEDGVVHFSEQAPPNRDYVRLIPENEARGLGVPVPEREQETDRQRDEPVADSASIGEGAPDPRLIAELCSQARQNLDALSQRRLFRVRDAGGGESYLEDDERSEVIAETREFIDRWC